MTTPPVDGAPGSAIDRTSPAVVALEPCAPAQPVKTVAANTMDRFMRASFAGAR